MQDEVIDEEAPWDDESQPLMAMTHHLALGAKKIAGAVPEFDCHNVQLLVSPRVYPPAPTRIPREELSGQGSDMVLLNEVEAEEIVDLFGLPSSLQVVRSAAMTLLVYLFYPVSCWAYCALMRSIVYTPCKELWADSPWGLCACEVSVLAAWTLPLGAVFVFTFYMYRDVLRTELYYNMLSHHVIINFRSEEPYEAPGVWYIMGHAVVASSTHVLAMQFSWKSFLLTLPYWMPFFCYFGVIYVTWQLESRLISLDKICMKVFDEAVARLCKCVHMRDYVAREAFQRISERLRDPQDKLVVKTSGQYIKSMVREAENLYRGMEESGTLRRMVRNNTTVGVGGAIYHEVMYTKGVGGYWVLEFLLCPMLNDKRAVSFRGWFQWYRWFTLFVVLLVSYTLVSSIVSHLHFEGYLADSWLTTSFRWRNLRIHKWIEPPPRAF